MITVILAILLGAKIPTIGELARTEKGYELPCGVEAEFDTVPGRAEIADMHRWARQEHDSAELESVWTQLRVRRALREYLENPRNEAASCTEFLIAYRIAWDRAAARADKIYGSSRKANAATLILSGTYTVSEPHPMKVDTTIGER